MTHPPRAPISADEFAQQLPFPLDPFQVDALGALEAGESTLVAAPTGSGKTVVAEYACRLALEGQGKCFYTTPLKALSNQKFGDLSRLYGAGNVGLLTGDNTVNGEAPLVVMTTEVLRNMLYERSATLSDVQWVVLDEVHYLQDPYRGAVWEEVLIHLPPDVRVVCLSATVSNVDEFGDWLRTLRGPTRVVVERRRPVELRNLVMVGEDLFPLLATEEGVREELPQGQAATGRRGRDRRGRPRTPEVNRELVRLWARGTAAAARYGRGAQQRRRRGEADRAYTPTRVEVAETLEHEKMLPAICFIFSRVGCNKAVEACIHARLTLTNREEAERIEEVAEMRAAELSTGDLRAVGFRTFVEGLKRGVAAHHAGVLPIFKETVEELFGEGLVKLVFATETLALGINMPAKTVVIERLTKFTGDRHEMLTPTDYTQLTGRAGRRGIDEVGHAVVLFSPWVHLEQLASLATLQSYELRSSFRPSYNMAVNLVRNYDPERAAHLLNSSFAQFAADRAVVQWERQLTEREREEARLREAVVCERGDVLEYRRLREEAEEGMRAERGSEAVRSAFSQLGPGDVIYGDRLGRALVCEQPRTGKGSGPRVTVMTVDRKLRRVTPRDFRAPPEPVARMQVKGRSWRQPKVRRHLARTLSRLDAPRPQGPAGRKKVRELVRAYEEHPCHQCPDVAEHLSVAEELVGVEAELDRLRRRVRRRSNTVARTFERVLSVLRTLEYLDEWELTPKGRLLRQVYNEADLLVVECLARGWLTGLDPDELVSVASLFVYETRGREAPESAPTPHLSRCQRRIMNLYRTLADTEHKEGLDVLKEPDSGFMAPVYEWSRGASLETVLEDRELSSGDFVRATKQVIDLLQQLRQVVPHGELAETLADGVGRVQRGVVAYSYLV